MCIEDTDVLPDPGATVTLMLVLSVHEPAFELEAEVVRHTKSGGFAVAFRAVEPRLKEFLTALLALGSPLPSSD